MMKQLELRYVAHVTTITGLLQESRQTEAATIRELVDELDIAYGGFRGLLVNPQTGQLNLNTMIYYSDPGQVPVSIIDLDHPIKDGGTATFW
jgi:hypothetical protein